MEAATPLNIPRVISLSDRLIADGLQIHDDAAIRLAFESEDPAAAIIQMIEIGARVLDRENAGAQVDVVRTEFESMRTNFDERSKAVAERMDQKIMEVLGADDSTLGQELKRLFGDESSEAIQHKLRSVLVDASEQMRDDLRKQLFSDGEDNPLAKFHRLQMEVAAERDKRQSESIRSLHEEIGELTKTLSRNRAEDERDAAVAEEAERGTAKGRTYEESVFNAVQPIAAGRGDDCDAIGDTVGDGGRKGDVLVSIDAASGPPRGRIVVEAKDRRLSKNAALEELATALEQRTADYAVLVVPSEDELPARCHQLQEFNGDKVFAVFDPDDGSTLSLEVALGLARARVLMDSSASEGIDEPAIRAEVEHALLAMEAVRKVKSQLTTATNGISSAQALIDVMATDVRERLAQIQVLLAAAADDEPAA